MSACCHFHNIHDRFTSTIHTETLCDLIKFILTINLYFYSISYIFLLQLIEKITKNKRTTLWGKRCVTIPALLPCYVAQKKSVGLVTCNVRRTTADHARSIMLFCGLISSKHFKREREKKVWCSCHIFGCVFLITNNCIVITEYIILLHFFADKMHESYCAHFVQKM